MKLCIYVCFPLLDLSDHLDFVATKHSRSKIDFKSISIKICKILGNGSCVIVYIL